MRFRSLLQRYKMLSRAGIAPPQWTRALTAVPPLKPKRINEKPKMIEFVEDGLVKTFLHRNPEYKYEIPSLSEPSTAMVFATEQLKFMEQGLSADDAYSKVHTAWKENQVDSLRQLELIRHVARKADLKTADEIMQRLHKEEKKEMDAIVEHTMRLIGSGELAPIVQITERQHWKKPGKDEGPKKYHPQQQQQQQQQQQHKKQPAAEQ